MDKFSPRAVPAAFLGYSVSKKGYTMYDLESKVFLTSRDVLFQEDVFPFKTTSTSPSHLFSPKEDELQSSYIENNAQSSFNIPAPAPSSSMDSSSMGDASVSETSTLQSPTVPVTRKSSRTTNPPIWMHDYVSTSKGSANCCYLVSDVVSYDHLSPVFRAALASYSVIKEPLLMLRLLKIPIGLLLCNLKFQHYRIITLGV